MVKDAETAPALKPPTPLPATWLAWGTIVSTASPPMTVGVKFATTAATVTGLRHLADYGPVVNDEVCVLVSGTDAVVLGKLA